MVDQEMVRPFRIKLTAFVIHQVTIGRGFAETPDRAMNVAGPSRFPPIPVLVTPRGRNASEFVPIDSGAIVFISDHEDRATRPEEMLRRTYGLTPAETALIMALLQGSGLRAADVAIHGPKIEIPPATESAFARSLLG